MDVGFIKDSRVLYARIELTFALDRSWFHKYLKVIIRQARWKKP
jgi:hypothetical protein